MIGWMSFTKSTGRVAAGGSLEEIQLLSPPSRRDHALREQQHDAPASDGNREKHVASLPR